MRASAGCRRRGRKSSPSEGSASSSRAGDAHVVGRPDVSASGAVSVDRLAVGANLHGAVPRASAPRHVDVEGSKRGRPPPIAVVVQHDVLARHASAVNIGLQANAVLRDVLRLERDADEDARRGVVHVGDAICVDEGAVPAVSARYLHLPRVCATHGLPPLP